jgi:hypothetical protein
MQESHRKDLANHPDPESCVVRGRKATIEALTGAHAGRVLSCEINPPAGRPCSDNGKVTREAALGRAASRRCAVGDPAHVWILHAREPGDPSDVRQ